MRRSVGWLEKDGKSKPRRNLVAPNQENMEANLKTPNLDYAAALLKKLISPLTAADPSAEDFKRLSGPLHEIAFAVLSEGRDKSARRNRLQAEMSARSIDLLMPEVDAADPLADLATLQTSSGWQVFDLADVMTEDIPPVKWVIRYFLSKPSVIVIFGRAKHKKTLVVLDMCHHIASGMNWMTSSPGGRDGIEVTTERVVWVDLENGTRLMKRRMKAFATALDATIPRGQFMAYSMPDPWLDLSKPENIPAMIDRIKALGNIGVLVIDHLAQVFGGIDENSPLASQIMGAIRIISEACNVGIVLIHHAKKGQGKDGGMIEDQLRGSGAILAGVDAAFLVEKDPTDKNQVTIKPVAVRGPDAPNISAKFCYEQDDNLDLTSARFWRIAYRSIEARAHDAIIQALQEKGKLNHTFLRAEAKRIDQSLSDGNIREGIGTLEGALEIIFIKGDKGAKIYELAGGNDEDE
jgi:hypothetical protein